MCERVKRGWGRQLYKYELQYEKVRVLSAALITLAPHIMSVCVWAEHGGKGQKGTVTGKGT